MSEVRTKLYSCYPHNCTVARATQVEKQIATERLRCLRQRPNGIHTKLTSRDLFPPLPWTMGELPGTRWRNVHTLASVTIGEIRENRHGHLGPDPDEWINAMFSIGLWWGGRFIIEHWVRADLLSTAEQMEWHLARVKYCIGKLYHATQSAEAWRTKSRRNSTYHANLRIQEHEVQRAASGKSRAIAMAQAFASQHSLTCSVSTLNRLTIQATQTAQLALF